MCADLVLLVERYAALVDAHAWDEVAALFTEDGVLVRPTAPDAPVAGRAAILAAFRARPARVTRHGVSDVAVERVGTDAARVRSRVVLQAGDAPPVVGGYEDEVVRIAGEWRFQRRVGFLLPPPGEGRDGGVASR